MGLQFTPTEYKVHIRMSGRKHLLVEGRGDKHLFKMLLRAFNYDKNALDIDTAEDLVGFEENLGNRERVEFICGSFKKKKESGYNRLVGFVDREFREFDFSSSITDTLARHNVIGRVIWSRGHSIENYYFEHEMLNRPLKEFSTTEYFEEALDLFKENFHSIVLFACAASLAGRDTEKLKVVRSSAGWEMFKFDNKGIGIDINYWKKVMKDKQHLQEDQVDIFLEKFSSWLEIVKKADFEVVRWMCHGHVGLSFIWAAYGGCVFEACSQAKCKNPSNQVQKVLKSEESVRFNACAVTWVEKAIGNQSVYPIEVLKLLKIRPVKN